MLNYGNCMGFACMKYILYYPPTFFDVTCQKNHINNISAKSEVSPALEQVNPTFLNNIYLEQGFFLQEKAGRWLFVYYMYKSWACVVTDDRFFCELEILSFHDNSYKSSARV